MAITLLDKNPNVPNCSGEHCSGRFWVPTDILHTILLNLKCLRDITALSLANRHLFTAIFSDNMCVQQLFKEFFPHSFAEFSKDPAEEKTIAAFNLARLRQKNVQARLGPKKAKSGNYLFQTHNCLNPGASVIHNDQLYYVDGKEIKIWDYQNGNEKKLKVSIIPSSEYRMISIENDYLIVGSDHNTIIFDLKTLKELRANTHALEKWANSTRLIHKDQLFFGSCEGLLSIWDLKDLDKAPKIFRTDRHPGAITKMLIHNNLLYIAIGDRIEIWDPDNMSITPKIYGGHSYGIRDFIIHKNFLILGTSFNRYIWNLEQNKAQIFINSVVNGQNNMLLHQGFMFIASKDQIEMYNSDNFAQPLKYFSSGDNQPICKIAAYDGLLIGADLKSIKIWEIEPHIINTVNYSPCILNESSKHFVIHNGRLFSSLKYGQIMIRDFNRPPEQEISLLKQFNMVCGKDFLQKLQCYPEFLPKAGIYSDEDLDVLGITPDQVGLEKLCKYLEQKDLVSTWQKFHLKGIYTLAQLSAFPELVAQGFFKLNQV